MSPLKVLVLRRALVLAGNVTSISPFMVEKLMLLSGVTLLRDTVILPDIEWATTDPDALVMVTGPAMLEASISPVIFSMVIASAANVFTVTDVSVGTWMVR